MPAPEDPTQCLAPCPPVTRRGGELLDLVRIARRQLRVGFGGVYGLDWPVLFRMADSAGIETDMEWCELLEAVEGELVEALQPKKDPSAG